MTLQRLEEDFALLERWEDKYRYLIEMGNTLLPVSEAEKNRANKVSGCVSQVWLVKERARDKLIFRGTSDALIVRGLIAMLLLIYSNKTSAEILSTDAHTTFERLGLAAHITPQRSDGFSAMVRRIQKDAQSANKNSSKDSLVQLIKARESFERYLEHDLASAPRPAEMFFGTF